jgi:hypothetical protein
MKHGSHVAASDIGHAAGPRSVTFAAICTLFVANAAVAQDAAKDPNELAKQLSNPVAALISVPFQLNYDDGYTPDGGGNRWTLNIQPVVPISISDSWNVISRTIVPVMNQNFAGPGNKESGLGDINESLFFSPKAPTASGWIIGAGPVLLMPTGTEGFTAHQWGAGPTFVVLKQSRAGPTACWPTRSGHLPATAGETHRTSVPCSCSRSSPRS